ncbi:hypothetical protein B0H34DRAFT_691041, partial [Crassisporium funariophilum]
MSSNENPPSLALSDIMHHMSPSPVPVEEQHFASGSALRKEEQLSTGVEAEGSPEPPTQEDMLAMRRRVHSMGLFPDGNQDGPDGSAAFYRQTYVSDANSREKELVDMILRLTYPLHADPSQLERQAETISALTSQRDFLMKQIEEERYRWRAERDGWDRMAEALLSRRNKPVKPAAKEDESERQRLQLESDNRALRVIVRCVFSVCVPIILYFAQNGQA